MRPRPARRGARGAERAMTRRATWTSLSRNSMRAPACAALLEKAFPMPTLSPVTAVPAREVHARKP